MVETLLDVKDYALSTPGIVDVAVEDIERRFYLEYKNGKFVNADHMEDRAVEIVSEVASDYMIGASDQPFSSLLNRALRLARNVRQVIT